MGNSGRQDKNGYANSPAQHHQYAIEKAEPPRQPWSGMHMGRWLCAILLTDGQAEISFCQAKFLSIGPPSWQLIPESGSFPELFHHREQKKQTGFPDN